MDELEKPFKHTLACKLRGLDCICKNSPENKEAMKFWNMAEKILQSIGYTTVYEKTGHLAFYQKDAQNLKQKIAKALTQVQDEERALCIKLIAETPLYEDEVRTDIKWRFLAALKPPQ